MIIDEILDNVYKGVVNVNNLDLAYIRQEAEMFEFDYLRDAVVGDDKYAIINALKKYLEENGYIDILDKIMFI